ncbi:MAG: hypothetical protein L0Y80_06050 [Ignavibacteriae bacterium]|nr:hypothetical protein [Ignavibacteriota bacterium]
MRMVNVLCSLIISSLAVAQVEPCLNVTSQTNRDLNGNSTQSLVQTAMQKPGIVAQRKLSPYRPALGASQFLFDGQSRTAPAMGIQYVPTEHSAGKWTFSGGLVWLPKSSTVITNSVGRPQFAGGGYGQSLPSLFLGYAGAEYRYYLLQGDVQPYVGAGAYGLGWKYGSLSGATLAPSVMGGVNAEISTVFSGYVELRQLIGVGTFLGSSTFGGSTNISAGLAFAPNLSRW